MTFNAFFEMVKNAEFGLDSITLGVTTFIDNLFNNAHIATLYEYILSYIATVLPYIPYVLLGVCAIILFWGKRLFPIIRFLAFFVVGFILGVYYLSPLVLEHVPTLPTWVIGVVAGIVGAVMAKLFYWLSIIAIAGYGVYMFCFTGTLIPSVTAYSKGNYLVSLVAASVVVLILLLLLKYVEMAGTAMLGGFGIASVVRGWYDYTTISIFVGKEWLGVLAATLVVALIGFAYQFKHRETFR